MRTSIKTFFFRDFGRQLDAAALVSALATACFDIQRCNEQIARAFEERDSNPARERWRGDVLYALRMMIGHFHEAREIIKKIEKEPYLRSLLETSDSQTKYEFSCLLEAPSHKLPALIRNNVSFHYQNMKLFKSAIVRRGKSEKHGHSKLERADNMSRWYSKFADDLIETILANGVTEKVQRDENLLLSSEAFGEKIGLITDDAEKMLSFGGELISRFVDTARK